MATSFKALNSNDVTRAQTKLHEAIPVTGTILSGTYNDNNIKNYSHGMFQSVYDYPYLSSSANHIIDLTAGWTPNSSLSSSANVVERNQKNDIYNEMSQMLAGYDTTGSINKLDVSGNFGSTVAADKINEALVAGEFNILYASSSAGPDNVPCGLVFYQAGVAILTASVFSSDFVENCEMNVGAELISNLLVSGSISSSCDAIRHRVQNISFNNTTELNSTIYFCRANNSEFNYSSNPTYLSSSQIRVKQLSTDNPVSYVTTVGLYSEDNALLAVAKVSEPIKKTPAEEYTLRVRLDY